jgi:Fe-S-cluster containining protein
MLDGLPALYTKILPSLFEREIPTETKATCANCAMCEASCKSAVEPVDGRSRFFRPDTKCCTYYPKLPNYLVGALLADEDPAIEEGRARVREKIARRVGVGPQWLRPPAKYKILYDNAHRAFGRSESLLCPYFEKASGSCSIWPYREAVCSTYFCKYVAGADGRKLWMSIKTFLSLAEIQLSRYTLLKLHPDYIAAGLDRDGAEGRLTADELDEAPLPERDHARLWGPWAGREVDLYKASFELVRDLNAAEFEKLLGLDGTIAAFSLGRLQQAAVSPELPVVLKLNPDATVKWLPDGTIALASYSEHDAVALPREAYDLLTAFTGTDSVEAVRGRLRKEKLADLDEEVLLVLYRHRILTEASP